MADGNQGFQNFDLALGHEQTGIVEGGGGGVSEAGEGEKIVVIEPRAIELVDGFYDADKRTPIHNGSSDERAHKHFSNRLISLNEMPVVWIRDASGFSIVRERTSYTFAGLENLALKRGGILAGLMQEFDSFVGQEQPDVDRLACEDFGKF